MKFSINRWFAVLFLFVCIVGCGGQDSSEIRTSKIVAELEVVTTEPNGIVKVKAKLKTRFGEDIRLEPEDSLWTESDGERKQLRPAATILSRNTDYSASFNGRAVEGKKVSISLLRDKHRDALNSVAVLPGPFVIDLPNKDATLSRLDDITLVWTPGRSEWIMDIKIIIYCTNGPNAETHFQFDDSQGMGILKPEEHSPSDVLEFDGECSFKFIFSRINKGKLSGEFARGYINAVQRRDIYITTTGK